ncbi:MAG: hypothetical protein ABIP35_14070 [Ginsengibacter sp.]
MKTNYILLIALAVAFSSCSTAYRTGQTPDDVYYSPAPVREVYVSTQNQDERDSYRYRNQEEEDIRRGIRDSRYRSNVSISLGTGYNPYYNNGYSYNPYSYNPYGYNSIYNSQRFDPFYDPYSYNPYSKYGGNYYSGYYSPYYAPIIVVPSGSNKINTNRGPRKYSLGAYNSPNTGARGDNGVIYHPGSQAPNVPPTRTFKATKETGVGNVLRRVFSAPSESSPRRYQSSSNDNNRDFAPQTSNSSSDNRPSSSRTFSNPTTPASSTPPATTAPVRTFRKN